MSATTRIHHYLSTACLHGEVVIEGRPESGHDYCKAHTGAAGAKEPASCKWCGAECECHCHREG